MTEQIIFAVLLAIAAAAVTIGFALIYPALGWIIGGLSLAGCAWLILGDVE